MFVTVLLAVFLGSPSLSAGWGCSGSFGAGEAKKAEVFEARGLPANLGGWSRLGAGNDWVLLDKFERNRPASKPMREAGFKLPKGSQVDQLYALIGFAESPRKGYDAIHMSATILPAGPPTKLTFGQIKAWISDTPGQHHAIGRYQIIPSTLLDLQARLGLSDSARFDQKTQDRMASVLLQGADYTGFLQGRVSASAFMENLAAIWAGLPLQDGKSAYHGLAGNRATISRTIFETQMARIFPERY